jgi:hypothetical protein
VWGDTGRVALVPVNTATCKTTHTLLRLHPAGPDRAGRGALRVRIGSAKKTIRDEKQLRLASSVGYTLGTAGLSQSSHEDKHGAA